MTPLLEVRGLSKSFPAGGGTLPRRRERLQALREVDLTLQAGETVALVGESGSGKTTLARCIMRLIEPDSGSIRFAGEDLLALRGAELRRRRRDFQMIFQDPYGSLNPRMRVDRIVAEPLEIHGLGSAAERARRVTELLQMVGLPAEAARRYPHEFSGGQRQRIGIARALAPEPRLLIADEPVSALDVSVQAQILNLLADLQRRLGLTLLVIAHDLALVEQVADRIGVLYLGRMAEIGPTRALFQRALHPYTVSLMSAVPIPEPNRKRARVVLPGEPPSPIAPPPGCNFHPRCPIAAERCSSREPELERAAEGRAVACHFAGEFVPRERPIDESGTSGIGVRS